MPQASRVVAPAEADPIKWHGPGPFDPVSGTIFKEKSQGPTYSQIFGQWLCDIAEKDPRVVGTIRAIERELLVDGLVLRYNSADVWLPDLLICRPEFAETVIAPSQVGILPSIAFLIGVAIGGRTTLLGPVLGAVGVAWAQTVFYIALFATLMFRPQGFFGGRLAQRF